MLVMMFLYYFPEKIRPFQPFQAKPDAGETDKVTLNGDDDIQEPSLLGILGIKIWSASDIVWCSENQGFKHFRQPDDNGNCKYYKS